MPRSNRQIVERAAIDTSSVTYGLLSAEQARQFLRQTFDATNFRPLIRHELRTAKTGEIDKIGIKSRILRSKVEGVDDGYRAQPEFGRIQYATTAVRLPWEITEETLRENIEGQNFESVVTDLMTTQLGIDMEDLDLNGDTAVSASDPDYDFLKVNDGWIKQLEAGTHVEDRTSKSSGAMSLDVFYSALKELPNKYNNGNLRWVMSPRRYQEWIYHILNQAVSNGGIITDGRIENPAAIPAVQCASMPDSKIILSDPKNFIEVATYDVKIRKTIEGKEAIMQDKRFYVVHLDFDPIIEELDAAVIIKGLASIS